ALGQRQRVGGLGAFARRQRAQKRVPVRARLAGRRQQLVVAAFEGVVAAEELSQHGMALRGITIALSVFMRGSRTRSSPQAISHGAVLPGRCYGNRRLARPTQQATFLTTSAERTATAGI